jgi:DNA-binding NarL/FixJ family response regulator
MSLRLLIADDHEALRMGLRTVVKSKPQWEICGEATDGEEAVAKARKLSPDVIILDLSMPTMNGYEAVAEIKKFAPAAKIVIFSMHEIPATARQVGADAFVSKSSAVRVLVETIERVAQNPSGKASPH